MTQGQPYASYPRVAAAAGIPPAVEVRQEKPDCPGPAQCAWSWHTNTAAPRGKDGQFPRWVTLKYIHGACGKHLGLRR